MHVSNMDLMLAALAMASGTHFRIFNDATNKVEELQDRLIELRDQMNNIQAKADAEQRQLTTDESKQIEEIFATFEETEADIDRRERLINAKARLSVGRGRQTDADNVANVGEDLASRPRRERPLVPAAARDPNDVGKWGFRSVGEFASAVRAAHPSSGGRNLDPRLIANAPTSYGSEGVGEDGGFAVPPDFRRDIMQKVMGEESMLSRTDQLTSSSNSITIPKDETTPWQTSGGIQAAWEGEGAQFSQSKPSLEQSTIRLNKLTALVPVTEELLSDAPALSTYLRRKTPEKFDFKINDAILNGTGAGQPLGHPLRLGDPAGVEQRGGVLDGGRLGEVHDVDRGLAGGHDLLEPLGQRVEGPGERQRHRPLRVVDDGRLAAVAPGQVGTDLLEPAVLILKRLQPAHLVRQQPAIPLLPVEIGRLADPRLAADLGHRRAFLALLQDKRLLRLREPRCFHRSQLLSQPGNVSRMLKFQTVQFSGGRA